MANVVLVRLHASFPSVDWVRALCKPLDFVAFPVVLALLKLCPPDFFYSNAGTWTIRAIIVLMGTLTMAALSTLIAWGMGKTREQPQNKTCGDKAISGE